MSEINSLPHVGGTVLCTLTGRIMIQELPNSSSDNKRGTFSQIIVDVFRKLDESGSDFVDVLDPDSGNTWIAVRYHGIILIVLLYPKADLYFIKLQLNLVVKKLAEEREVKKM